MAGTPAKDITHLEAMAWQGLLQKILYLGAVAGIPAKDIALRKYEQ